MLSPKAAKLGTLMILTNDIQAANNKIFTNKSSNCSKMSSHNGLPAI